MCALPHACAQVHSAVLAGSKKEVVIKVLRPGTEDVLLTDLNFVSAPPPVARRDVVCCAVLWCIYSIWKPPCMCEASSTWEQDCCACQQQVVSLSWTLCDQLIISLAAFGLLFLGLACGFSGLVQLLRWKKASACPSTQRHTGILCAL
jgi:hypothetical protein